MVIFHLMVPHGVYYTDSPKYGAILMNDVVLTRDLFSPNIDPAEHKIAS